MSVTSDSDYGRYLFEYRYGNSEWGIEIAAKSPQEARERLNALAWAHYKGEIAATIPVPGARLVTRIIALFRS
jgi:hypothetical protein